MRQCVTACVIYFFLCGLCSTHSLIVSLIPTDSLPFEKADTVLRAHVRVCVCV